MITRVYNIYQDRGKLTVESSVTMPIDFEVRGGGVVMHIGRVQACVFMFEDDESMLLDYVGRTPPFPMFIDDEPYVSDPRSLGQEVPNELTLKLIPQQDEPLELRFYTK